MTDTRMDGHMNTRLRSSGRADQRALVQPRALTDLRLQIGALRRASCFLYGEKGEHGEQTDGERQDTQEVRPTMATGGAPCWLMT